MWGLSNLAASLQIYFRRKLMSFPKVQFLKKDVRMCMPAYLIPQI